MAQAPVTDAGDPIEDQRVFFRKYGLKDGYPDPSEPGPCPYTGVKYRVGRELYDFCFPVSVGRGVSHPFPFNEQDSGRLIGMAQTFMEKHHLNEVTSDGQVFGTLGDSRLVATITDTALRVLGHLDKKRAAGTAKPRTDGPAFDPFKSTLWRNHDQLSAGGKKVVATTAAPQKEAEAEEAAAAAADAEAVRQRHCELRAKERAAKEERQRLKDLAEADRRERRREEEEMKRRKAQLQAKDGITPTKAYSPPGKVDWPRGPPRHLVGVASPGSTAAASPAGSDSSSLRGPGRALGGGTSPGYGRAPPPSHLQSPPSGSVSTPGRAASDHSPSAGPFAAGNTLQGRAPHSRGLDESLARLLEALEKPGAADAASPDAAGGIGRSGDPGETERLLELLDDIAAGRPSREPAAAPPVRRPSAAESSAAVPPTKGPGHVLGGSSAPPPQGGQSCVPSRLLTAPTSSLSAAAADSQTLSGPTTTLCLQLPGGQRVQHKFALSATLTSVGEWAATAAGRSGDPTTLQTNFPRRVYSNLEQSIEAAGLANAVLTVTFPC
eukprot:TRINITY_DN6719_c2_g1_i1.p1 TRINITY_DN6719_c2_g1~~TRINITY_DN6719_c2_g1_i1.p1  ORF type:complete len:566 (+),score=83.57 TRINITY_DN6719_c2_g1_i1:48-1700(+)